MEEFVTQYAPLLQSLTTTAPTTSTTTAATATKSSFTSALFGTKKSIPTTSAQNNSPIAMSAKDKAIAFLTQEISNSGDFQIGKNRIFLRLTSFEQLERVKSSLLTQRLSKFQAIVRTYLIHKQYKQFLRTVVLLQSFMRSVRQRNHYQRTMASIVAEKLRAKRTVEQRNQVGSVVYRCRVLYVV